MHLQILWEKQLENLINQLEIEATICIDQEALTFNIFCESEEEKNKILDKLYTILENVYLKLGLTDVIVWINQEYVLELDILEHTTFIAENMKSTVESNNTLSIKECSGLIGIDSSQLAKMVEESRIPINLKNGQIAISLNAFEGIVKYLHETKFAELRDSFIQKSAPLKEEKVVSIASNNSNHSVLDISKWSVPRNIKKRDTEACVKAAIDYLDDKHPNMHVLSVLMQRTSEADAFVEQMATKLMHHLAKNNDKKREEVRLSINNLWNQLVAA